MFLYMYQYIYMEVYMNLYFIFTTYKVNGCDQFIYYRPKVIKIEKLNESAITKNSVRVNR